MAATDRQWYVTEDGCLSVGENVTSVTYHSSLNSIILTTNEPSLKILDATSGVLLQKSNLSAKNCKTFTCAYLAEKDKTVFCDGQSLGVRKHIRGVLLLDTALQVPVIKNNNVVKVELPLAEATQLFKSLVNAELSGVEHVEDVLKELEKELEITQEATKGNHKLAKWATVCLRLPHYVLKGVCSGFVNELKRSNVHNPGLPIASAICDRLMYLLPSSIPVINSKHVDRSYMYSEASRLETFRKWPHQNYKWATPEPMAQAGFYHHPNSSGDDRAMCFTCSVCLVCWEPTDEPWSEHERHSPACPFVKGESTQNVPLSVTYATQPAQRHGDSHEKIHCVSSTANEDYIATSTRNGNIAVWNISRVLKKHCQFNLDPADALVALKMGIQFDSCKESMDSQEEQKQSTGPEELSRSGSECKVGGSSECCAVSDELQQVSLHDSEVHEDIPPCTQRARPSDDVLVHSLCVVDNTVKGLDKPEGATSSSNKLQTSKCDKRLIPQPTLLCGVSLRRTKCVSGSEDNEMSTTTNGRSEAVQLMNQVNQVVSSDIHSRIITNSDHGSDFVRPETNLIPYLLVVAAPEAAPPRPVKKDDNTDSTQANMARENTVVVTGSSSSMHPDWTMFLENDQWADPDIQIIGFTPAPNQPVQPKFKNPIHHLPKGVTVNHIGNSITIYQSNSHPHVVEPQLEELEEVEESVPNGPKAGMVLQCVEFPVEFQKEYLEVHSITPSIDKQYVIVVLAPKSEITSESSEEDSVMENSHPAQPNGTANGYHDTYCGGAILVYKLIFNDVWVTLNETPVAVHGIEQLSNAVTKVLVLPQEMSDQAEDDDLVNTAARFTNVVSSSKVKPSPCLGQLAVTLKSGSVWLLNLADMKLLSEIQPPEDDTFLSLTYCIGIERLCGCTNSGKLLFYQISEQSPDLQDGPLELDSSSSKEWQDDATVCKKAKLEDVIDQPMAKLGQEFLAKRPLTAEVLSSFHSLIQFENLYPRYTATVPPCWSEIQQEQQQRRHPQHLQQQGEATQHTRTWKLTPDSANNTWNEHLLEIVLPRPCCVGHVDLKFTLHPVCTSDPNIEVTLLKQNIGNIRKSQVLHQPEPISVDQKVDFILEGSSSDTSQPEFINNVLDPAFLELHNAEILCGPVKISNCMDLSGSGGLVSLTSPQLLNSKPRSLLLHIKGFQNTSDETSKENKKKANIVSSAFKPKTKSIKSLFENVPHMPGTSATERLAATAPKQKLTDVKGCDWLQEISVTVRKMKRTHVLRERAQRNAMIDLQAFHEKLTGVITKPNESELAGVGLEHAQNMALDILSWIASIQMSDPQKRKGSRCLVTVIQQQLRELVKACFIDGSRTTAHKCARLFALLTEYVKVAADPNLAPTFSYLLLQSILACLPLIPCAMSAGAMKWYFTLLNHIKCMDIGSVSKSCTELLGTIAKQYHERSLPMHALLKARYGLYGHPFEPDLFDVENPPSLKQAPSSTQSALQASKAGTVGSTAGSNTSTPQQSQEDPDLYEMLSLSLEKTGKTQIEYARSHVLGLLEAEPLHFVCHATSDSTRVERMDTSTNPPIPTGGPLGMSGTINFGENPSPLMGAGSSMSGTAMADSLKKLAQTYAKQLHPSYKQIEQAITEAMHTPLPTKAPDLFPPTPKTTPNMITPSVTPPNETWHFQVVGPPTVSKFSGGSESDIIKQQQVPPPATTQASTASTPSTTQANTQHQQPKSSLPFPQTLLQAPPPQVLVIERMHSGARRFVTLDFGKPIILTDVIIPACVDLASLSIDVWIQGEEVDGQRLVVASDIGMRTLVMNNIMPSPICRYLKITTVGRYGTGTTKSRIPIGSFYGHSYILPWEWKEYLSSQTGHSSSYINMMELQSQSQLLTQLSLFISLQEDLHCRYSLVRTRLENMLSAVDSRQFATSHVQYYLKKNRKGDQDWALNQSYSDCLQLQLQLNLAQRAITRLQRALGIRTGEYQESAGLDQNLQQCSTDKLRIMLENLLDTLLSMTTHVPSIPQPPLPLYISLNPQSSEALFRHLCLLGTRRIQVCTGLLLARICGSQSWWGNFLGSMLLEFFNSEYTQVFPQDRVFVLLSALGQRALTGPSCVNIMESLLAMLSRVLSPLTGSNLSSSSSFTASADRPRNMSACLDLSLVSWILLFLCRNFDNSLLVGPEECEKGVSKKDRDAGSFQTNRWGFIQGQLSTNPSKSKTRSGKLYRRSLQKRILHHKQRLHELELAKKKFLEKHMEKSGQSMGKEAQALLKQQEQQFQKELSQYASKHLKDIIHIRRTDPVFRKMQKDDVSGSSRDMEEDPDICFVLPRERCLTVVRGLMALLLSMDYTCHVDLFLIACKVFARICNAARPAITLAEAMTQDQLEQLILLTASHEVNHGDVSWGGSWAGHAITCLLQDILDGERLFPPGNDLPVMTDEEMSVSETDDNLAQSVSLTTFDDSNGEMADLDSAQLSDNGQSLEKDASIMVDLLLEESEFDDEATDKLHEYVTGESVKPPGHDGPFNVIYMGKGMGPTASIPSVGNELADHIKSSMSGISSSSGTPGLFTWYDKNQKLKNLKSKLADYLNTAKSMSGCLGLSSALDARLELGLETQAELRLRVMLSAQMDSVHSAFLNPLPPAPPFSHSVSQSQSSSTDDELSEANLLANQQRTLTSCQMLSQCFNHLFAQLLTQRVNLETVLQLWLTMNDDGIHDDCPLQPSFDSSRVPSIPLDPLSVTNLLEAVVLTPNLPVRTWVFVFQALCLLSNQRTSADGADVSMVSAIISDNSLVQLLTKFLSGTSSSGPTSANVCHPLVGPSACKAFDDFLRRLQIKSAELSTQNLKELVLKIIHTLTTERGALYSCMGPLDVQCKFMDFVLDIQFRQVNTNSAVNVIQSISYLAHQHIFCQEKVGCRGSLENSGNCRSCFGGLFHGLLRGESRTAIGEVSRDRLLCNMLRLVNNLMQIPIPNNTPSGFPVQEERYEAPSLMVLDNLFDTSRLNPALATSTPTAISDDEKGHQTDEQKTESAAAVAAGIDASNPDRSQVPEVVSRRLCDVILGHPIVMQNLMRTLSFCNSDTSPALIGHSGLDSLTDVLPGDPLSVGDGICQIMLCFMKHTSDTKLVLKALYEYLAASINQNVVVRMSEPLLWFIICVLDNSKKIQMFLEMGGIDVVCRNLVRYSNTVIDMNPSLVSTIMLNMNYGRTGNMDKSNDLDPDSLQNFAPLGSISSSSPTASPADVLIQTSPPHRRARSAAWSYHFYPDEVWVDLTIHLPFAILLKEVQIQPHGSSISTCPSFVSLEMSHDGSTLTPLCPPLRTSSLAYIKILLPKPEVTSSVTVRLHRALDSMTIGLSQILLMGFSAFRDINRATFGVYVSDDATSRSSVGWVRVLDHCLSSQGDTQDAVAAAAAPTPNLLGTCTSLLMSSMALLYSPQIEAVLLKIGLHSKAMGLALIDNILRSPAVVREPGQHAHLGHVGGAASESTVELLYQLGTVQDTGTMARVRSLLQWLNDSAQAALQKSTAAEDGNYPSALGDASWYPLPNPAAAHVHCVSAILWQSQELPVSYDLGQLLNKELVRTLYEWSAILPVESLLKKAIDYVMCSMCHIQPEFFTTILEWMRIIISFNSSLNASISDDCKDFHFHQGTMTDDSKEANPQPERNRYSPAVTLQEFRHMTLNKSRLATLAVVCMSPVAIKQLLDSGFPAVLAQILYEFCKKEMTQAEDDVSESTSQTNRNVGSVGGEGSGVSTSEANASNRPDKDWVASADLVSAILDFFAEVCAEFVMKDWIGSPEGNIFWPILLTMLCNAPQSQTLHSVACKKQIMTAEERSNVETSAIRFFTNVISCHSVNQLLFAKVLCDVIREQGNNRSGPFFGAIPLSGFTRRVLLQVLLEDERVVVALHRSCGNMSMHNRENQIHHPQYGAGQCFCTARVNLNIRCADLISLVGGAPLLTHHFVEVHNTKKKMSDDSKKDACDLDLGLEVVEYLSNAAGMCAKEKREKSPSPSKNNLPPLPASHLPPRPPTRRGRHTVDDPPSHSRYNTYSQHLLHKAFKNKTLPRELSLSQVIYLLNQQGSPHFTGAALQFTIELRVKTARSRLASYLSADQGVSDDWASQDNDVPDEVLLRSPGFPSALQVFASVGGLALLAEHLPLLYPEITRQASSPEATTENNNIADLGQDWVTVESSDEYYDPYVEPLSPAQTTSRAARHAAGAMPSIPPHSLIAFGLFLRLPGYAEVLLKERKKAQCLLRLVLGVTDDGDGGHILTSCVANLLPTLPFTVLKSLFDATPLSTDDGVLLRRMALDIGTVHLILACLSVLSHHAPRVASGGLQQETNVILSAMQTNTSQPTSTQTEEKNQSYWAKGTGFGTGSTTSSWDAEQALIRQKSEEEHVTCLLQVLGSYINPSGQVPEGFDKKDYLAPAENTQIPEVMPNLLGQSCLVPAISSYLRNDSVLDMARHVPLYRSLLELLRGLAVCRSLVPLLRTLDRDGSPDTATAIEVLLEKMKGCVDTYASRLKSNKGKNGSTKVDEEESEGLALLIPDIQETARIVKTATDRLRESLDETDLTLSHSKEKHGVKIERSLEEKYVMVMKILQFDTYEMVREEGNGLKFVMPHHYESNVKAAGEMSTPSRTRRLAQEAVTLSTSLPLSASSSVFVRCDEERLDIMKVLITGPSDTPYANGCFEFDVYFPQDYPNSPPYINLETTGNHTIRFNPNLYNDGKVCLSVLNTWHGRPEEKWNAQTSSFLQVLVSIQSLILVNEPYFNEPGYERSKGTASGTASSREYDANIRQATVKWAMLEILKNTQSCFKSVIHNHFWLKRHEILKQCEDWITEMEAYSNDKRTGRSIAHSTLALKRHYNQLREELAKLKPPGNLEEEDVELIDPQGKHYSTDQSAQAETPDKDSDASGFSVTSNTMLLDPLGISQDIPDC
ncbi:baculoviral IAP repeat-containing protein 6-like isoform X2 [Gigantopelta aegis]|uniref:baculoviral IAP repeat-containing protein 6-like isoform X2 n=1 Tax=Gigantopelta aegis TaxID=1735272 RepID=UPI001B88A463|nr:baculoviral IAP repeat-containing protein 6-like isoform X2 [Gigantopelta aegis]